MLVKPEDFPGWQRAIEGPNGCGSWFYYIAPNAAVAGISERGDGRWSIAANHQFGIGRSMAYAIVPTRQVAERMVARWAAANRARLVRECREGLSQRGVTWHEPK